MMTACMESNQMAVEQTYVDILSQKPTQKDKIPITVLVKYAFTINGFEKIVEEKFPNIDIIQVGNFTRDMGIAEYAARLEHNDLPDMVMSWPLDIGRDFWEENLIDLSGMSFTSKYNISMLNKIADESGALYYLPGPAQVRGIVYNKTMFEENKWQVPSDYEGFIKLCKDIEASGVKALQLGLKNSEVLDTAFFGFNYGNSFSKPEDAQWLNNYNKGEGSLADSLTPALENFQRLVDEKILTKEDLNVDYATRETMLFSRKCAMVEDSVLMARMGSQLTGTTDKFALMPFFSPNNQSDWARLYMVCYIGLNKKLQNPENSEKYEAVLNLMDYVSTPDGQLALAADTGAMFSSLTDAKAPSVPEVDNLRNTLEQGRYGIFPEFKNSSLALREGLAGMIDGSKTINDVIETTDKQNASPAGAQAPIKLGTATERFSMVETGGFVADAMRKKANTDIALFLDNGKDGRYNGKGISGSIYEGEVTNVDVARILPDLKHGEKGVLCTIKLSGENLLKTLEYAIPVDNNQTGWFYYFSGLKMEYDVTAEPGKRIGKIVMEDGSELENSKMYTIAVMDETVSMDYVVDYEETNETITSVVENAVKEAKTISPAKDNRFTVK